MKQIKKGYFMALVLMLSVSLGLYCFPSSVEAAYSEIDPAANTQAVLTEGVNIIKAGAENTTYNIGEGQVLMIANQQSDAPIVFKNCIFKLSGETVKISGSQDGIAYNNGEVVTKLWIGGNIQFDNCQFTTDSTGTKSSSAGYDACIYLYSGDIVFNSSKLTADGYNGQFLGLFGSTGSVTFNASNIQTTNNKNGWSYAMYGGSVLKLLNGSTLSATGMSTDSGNTNAFYSGDNRTSYDAIFVKDSTIDFSDNQASGFALNNINIHVDHSTIRVNNNKGNACNSGMWYVKDSTIQMNGNRGGHALSCIGFEMTNTALEIMHNGYAGVYVQSVDSSLDNCTVDLRCNGEKLLSYSAGDLWLNGYTLTVANCTSQAQPGSAWLGAVGRKGTVSTQGENSSVVAYDLNSNAEDNLKSNTAPVLTEAKVVDGTTHTLFLNPFMQSAYARGNAESTANNNDADLFKDDHVDDASFIINKDTAKIGELTTAQLGHHLYDFDNGEVVSTATMDNFGVLRYQCTECAQYLNQTDTHPGSFDCQGTYVYAPLVSLVFDANTTDEVANMPEDQTAILYGEQAKEGTSPTREGYQFAGWFLDKEGTEPFDFATALTTPMTTVYAKWIPKTAYVVEHQYYTSTNGGAYVLDGTYTTEAVSGNAGDTIYADQIKLMPVYNETVYTFDHASGDLVLAEEASQNKMIFVYYRAVTVDLEPEDPGNDAAQSVETGDQTPLMMLAFGLTFSALGAALLVKRKIHS